MSESLTDFDSWPTQIASARIPANNNVRRMEILVGPVISATTTAQPLSPNERDIYIIPAGATGSQWGSFLEDEIAIYYEATWTAFTPFPGLRKFVEDQGEDWQYIGSSSGGWSPAGGGGGDVSSVNGQTGIVVLEADDIDYDNVTSGLTATDVQAAIDELASLGGATKFVNVALSDMTTDLTTGTAKAAWFAPEAGELVSVFIGVHDPSSSGVVRVDMNDSGGTVFTTRPAIDATEATSLTGTIAVLDGTISFAKGDKFTFDIDDAGTDAKGLQICVEYSP